MLKAFLLILLCFIAGAAYSQRADVVHQVDAGILAGQSGNLGLTVQAFNGVGIKSIDVQAGINVGLDVYPELMFVPISAGVKWIPFKFGAFSPVGGLNIGSGFGLLADRQDDQKVITGLMINPYLGLRLKSKTESWNLNIGYKNQRASVQTGDLAGDAGMFIKEDYTFRRVSVTLGFDF